ncbi:hypothetical protein FGG08_001133 [Glutinoglossum americanum]|uniref:Uncharacterized protein n=1 Tax=Glutinoglossum americanum TaxID=1670608 RepID=A0A9P8L337_9PEZI|nr:hypothetical protein FGG08_001133 [Glutinoglossum americanum]
MRLSATLGLLAGLASFVVAEDLLFLETLQDEEYNEATTTLSFSAKVVTEADWRSMSTADFAAFKAIIIGDSASSDLSLIQVLEDTQSTWGPAVTGNMILIGTDPSNHFGSEPGAGVLIDNAIKFAASGKTPTGATSTGFYMALAHYYDGVDTGTITSLSYFGEFGMRGNLDCYDNSHIVASSPALGTLTDDALSNWSCSVHEAFSKYPSTGINGFQALAIAKDIIGDGSQTFGDGTIGLPYIISRGATPAGCGDGKFDASLGEECDDGNTANGDGCSASCKCESGKPKGDGTCLPAPGSNTTSSSNHSIPTYPPTGYVSGSKSTVLPSGSAGHYTNSSTAVIGGPGTSAPGSKYPSSATPPYPITTPSPYTAPPYVTPGYPTGPIIIGVEVIVDVTVIESCTTVNPTSTITSYVTSACSTMHKPIFDTSMSEYPCYVCALESEGITCPGGSFLTVTTTVCNACAGKTLPTPVLPIYQTCSHCSALTLTESAIWLYTPLPGSDYCVPAPTPAPHSEHAATYTAVPSYTTVAKCSTCTLSTIVANAPAATGTAYISPVTTPVAFTGGAAGTGVELLSLIAGALLAIPMLL